MRLLVLGGSAFSTPWLLHELARRCPQPLDVVLAGRSAPRLQAVRRACEMAAPRSPHRLELASIAEPSAWGSLGRGDVVLVQVRAGGLSGRRFDESFPLGHGCCGDEGLGPGGLSAGLRNWPVLRPLLHHLAAASEPPLVLLLSSPLGLLVRTARLVFPRLRLAGICELPWTTLSDTCRDAGEEPETARFCYLGVNHLGWFHELSAGGRDLVAERAERAGEGAFPAPRVVRACGGLPLSDLRLHYEAEALLSEQRRDPSRRVDELERVALRAFEAYETGGAAEVEAALRARPAPWYRHAVAPLVAALAGVPSRIPFFLTVRNDGYEPSLLPGEILECPHVLDSGKLRKKRPSRPAPGHILQTVGRLLEYERVAAGALASGRLQEIGPALARHPWVRDGAQAAALASEIGMSLHGIAA